MQAKKTQQQQTKKLPRFLLYTLIFTAAIIIAGGILVFPMMFEGAENTALIKIPENATSKNVADSLTKYFGKSYSDKIMRYTKIRGIDFAKRHGAYLIEEGMSPFKGMIQICRRGQTPLNITINGFRSLSTLAGRVAAKTDFTAEEFLKLAEDSTYLAQYGLKPGQSMSLFLDDTYEIYWSNTPREVLDKIAANYKSIWNEERRKKASSLGASPADISIIASITDEETNKKNEKGTIGRLYLNRLSKGMKLQSDPTVRFALNDFTIKRVKGNHLAFDSPYNTYMYAGLPPGPIRTTSVATIDSILNSKPSGHLYMCAKEDFSGYHNFSDNYSDHVKNALRYQHQLDLKGIK